MGEDVEVRSSKFEVRSSNDEVRMTKETRLILMTNLGFIGGHLCLVPPHCEPRTSNFVIRTSHFVIVSCNVATYEMPQLWR